MTDPAHPDATTPPIPDGLKELLMGPAGTGKTSSIGTLVDTGIEVFYLALEPGMESLQGYYRDKGREMPSNLHFHRVAAPSASISEMMASAKMVNTLSYEALCKVTDPNRGKYNQFYGILESLNNFKDDRTGEAFGPVDSWGSDRVLVIDSLSGLSRASLNAVVGGRPTASQPDWGIAMTQVERLITMLCEGCKCHFVLLAHVEREVDEVQGGVKIMVSTLGKKLAPKFPQLFSDVIMATRQGEKWFWDTANSMADVKFRYLPLASNNPPDFAPILEKWKKRWGLLQPTGK